MRFKFPMFKVKELEEENTKYSILTPQDSRIAGSIKEYFTIQYVLGTRTRCKILNIEKFNAHIESNNYSVVAYAL